MFEYRGTIDMKILSMALFSELLNLRRSLYQYTYMIYIFSEQLTKRQDTRFFISGKLPIVHDCIQCLIKC